MPSLPLPQGKPLDVPRTVHQALELHHQGRIAEAEQLYAAVLAARPDHIDALQMLGVIKLSRGDLVTALRLRLGGDAAAAEVAADAFELRPRSQRHEPPRGGAGELRRRRSSTRAGFAEALNNRGSVLVALGRSAEALDNFKRAIAIKPDYAEAFYNQGNALQGARPPRRGAQELRPRHRAARRTTPRRIATAARCSTSSAGRPTRSRATTARWRSSPISPRRCSTAAARCARCKRIDETLQGLDRLLAAAPGLCRSALHARHADGGFQPHRRGAGELREGGGAQARLQQGALGLVHGGAADPLRRGSRDRDATRRIRAAAAGAARRLRGRTHPRRHVQGPRHGAAVLPRLPGPQRPRSADACSAASRRGSWPTAIGGGARPAARAGRAGARRHRQRLLLPAFGLEGRRQGLGHATRSASASRCSATTPAPSRTPRPRSRGRTATASCRARTRPRRWRQIILADRPHVLLYPEIGMNHEASELAALRLAPVQCSYIGHPQTSGFPTIDYFLSGELIEPPDGQDHYSEKLVKLPNVGFHYEPLELRAGGGDPRGTGAAAGCDGLLVRAIAVQISAAARRGVPAHRARSRRLPVRVHPPFRPGRHRAVPAAARSRLRGRRPQGRGPLRVPATAWT